MEGPNPNRSFMTDLKRLDKALGIKFNGDHFVITYAIPNGRTVNIWRVVAEDGGFRQPDHRDIEILQQSNIERESPEEKHKRVEQYMEAVREHDRKKSREMFRDITQDNRIRMMQLLGRLDGSGKYNSAFRRIPIIGQSDAQK